MIINDLKELIQKYSRKIQVRTQELIQDINGIIQKHEQQLPNKEDTTLLEDVRAHYVAKHWTVPNRYKNDITRLSSKI